MDTKGRRGGGMNWETGIDVYTLMCIKQITNKTERVKSVCVSVAGWVQGAVLDAKGILGRPE